jgi:hypothetical protein
MLGSFPSVPAGEEHLGRGFSAVETPENGLRPVEAGDEFRRVLPPIIQDEGIIGKMLPTAAGKIRDHMKMIGRKADLGLTGRNMGKRQEGMRPSVIRSMTDAFGQGRGQFLALDLVLDHGEHPAEIGISQPSGLAAKTEKPPPGK